MEIIPFRLNIDDSEIEVCLFGYLNKAVDKYMRWMLLVYIPRVKGKKIYFRGRWGSYFGN